MSQNGQTHFKIAAFAARFLKECVTILEKCALKWLKLQLVDSMKGRQNFS